MLRDKLLATKKWEDAKNIFGDIFQEHKADMEKHVMEQYHINNRDDFYNYERSGRTGFDCGWLLWRISGDDVLNTHLKRLQRNDGWSSSEYYLHELLPVQSTTMKSKAAKYIIPIIREMGVDLSFRIHLD